MSSYVRLNRLNGLAFRRNRISLYSSLFARIGFATIYLPSHHIFSGEQKAKINNVVYFHFIFPDVMFMRPKIQWHFTHTK